MVDQYLEQMAKPDLVFVTPENAEKIKAEAIAAAEAGEPLMTPKGDV